MKTSQGAKNTSNTGHEKKVVYIVVRASGIYNLLHYDPMDKISVIKILTESEIEYKENKICRGIDFPQDYTLLTSKGLSLKFKVITIDENDFVYPWESSSEVAIQERVAELEEKINKLTKSFQETIKKHEEQISEIKSVMISKRVGKVADSFVPDIWADFDRFLSARIVIITGKETDRVVASKLCKVYKEWCESKELVPPSSQIITQNFAANFVERKKVGGQAFFYGVRFAAKVIPSKKN